MDTLMAQSGRRPYTHEQLMVTHPYREIMWAIREGRRVGHTVTQSWLEDVIPSIENPDKFISKSWISKSLKRLKVMGFVTEDEEGELDVTCLPRTLGIASRMRDRMRTTQPARLGNSTLVWGDILKSKEFNSNLRPNLVDLEFRMSVEWLRFILSQIDQGLREFLQGTSCYYTFAERAYVLSRASERTEAFMEQVGYESDVLDDFGLRYQVDLLIKNQAIGVVRKRGWPKKIAEIQSHELTEEELREIRTERLEHQVLDRIFELTNPMQTPLIAITLDIPNNDSAKMGTKTGEKAPQGTRSC